MRLKLYREHLLGEEPRDEIKQNFRGTKSKVKKKKMFFGDTDCPSQWLPNSFFSTLTDTLEISSKDLVLSSNTQGISPGPSFRLRCGALRLWARPASTASNQSADSAVLERCLSDRDLPAATFPQRLPPANLAQVSAVNAAAP